MSVSRFRRALVAFCLVASSCAENPPIVGRVTPIILDIDSAVPMVRGTSLRVSVANLDALGEDAVLVIGGQTLDAESVEGGEAVFLLTSGLLGSFGEGQHDVDVVIRNDEVESEPFAFLLDVTTFLPIRFDQDIDELVHWNDELFLEGDGFLELEEGAVTAIFSGEFELQNGVRAPVVGELPVLQAEHGNRQRGVVILSTDLGSILPGTFQGEVYLRSELAGSSPSESVERDIQLEMQPTTFTGLSPEVASLESVVSLRGGGFLGGELGGDGLTLIRVDGTFTPIDGGGRSFREELILSWRSNEELQLALTADSTGETLISELFGASRGVLDAMFTPINILGSLEYEGIGNSARLELGPVRQVVWLRFLPGFYVGLPSFGLAAAAGRIEALIAQRIESIYADWNVDVRTSRPLDATMSGITVIEIGGPDPNGRGLFGYDNSPGKDVGNLRLFDAIGGANAESQADGYEGYGGVFIDGFLFFSESGAPTEGAGPDPDPLFDEIFDGVRNAPATLAEVEGRGGRVAEVERATQALSSMVGETTAHELGHSFGLADPFGSSTVFHNRVNRPGCLMDSGSSRPFGERSAQSGFEATHVCGDNAEYLDDILGER